MKIIPLGKQVLIRMVHVDVNTQGIHVPQCSIEGKEFHVEATGTECIKGLKVGDKVMFTGMKNSTYADVPGHPHLLVTNEDFVLLKFVEDDELLNTVLKPDIEQAVCYVCDGTKVSLLDGKTAPCLRCDGKGTIPDPTQTAIRHEQEEMRMIRETVQKTAPTGFLKPDRSED